MFVQYRFSVYFLQGFTKDMHWLQIITAFQIFLSFWKSQIHNTKLFCLTIFYGEMELGESDEIM